MVYNYNDIFLKKLINNLTFINKNAKIIVILPTRKFNRRLKFIHS